MLESKPGSSGKFVEANVLYMQGTLGPTLFKGGDGTADTRYLETVTFVQHQLMETARWALEHLPWAYGRNALVKFSKHHMLGESFERSRHAHNCATRKRFY